MAAATAVDLMFEMMMKMMMIIMMIIMLMMLMMMMMLMILWCWPLFVMLSSSSPCLPCGNSSQISQPPFLKLQGARVSMSF